MKNIQVKKSRRRSRSRSKSKSKNSLGGGMKTSFRAHATRIRQAQDVAAELLPHGLSTTILTASRFREETTALSSAERANLLGCCRLQTSDAAVVARQILNSRFSIVKPALGSLKEYSDAVFAAMARFSSMERIGDDGVGGAVLQALMEHDEGLEQDMEFIENACFFGFVSVVRSLLHRGRPHVRWEGVSNTLGSSTSFWGAQLVLETLLAAVKIGNPRIRDTVDWFALLMASAESGYVDAVKMLIKSGLFTPPLPAIQHALNYACAGVIRHASSRPRSHYDTVKVLLSQCPHYTMTPRVHNIGAMRALLEDERIVADPQSPTNCLGVFQSHQYAPDADAIVELAVTCYRTRNRAAECIALSRAAELVLCTMSISHAFNVNVSARSCELLLTVPGIDVNAAHNSFSLTPILAALNFGQATIARQLLAAGATLSHQLAFDTLLEACTIAICTTNKDLVRLMLDAQEFSEAELLRATANTKESITHLATSSRAAEYKTILEMLSAKIADNKRKMQHAQHAQQAAASQGGVGAKRKR